MRNDPEIRIRVFRSYILFLDFLGLQIDEETGAVTHTPQWKIRYNNWMGTHNNLRVCRCIKSMRELGLVKYTRPFVERLMADDFTGKIMI